MTNRMRMALTIYYTACHPAYFTRSCEKGPGNGRFSQMIRAFCKFRSERKKRTTSGGCPQFPKRFSGKLPFHLISNRNFRIFWQNGKHPVSLVLGSVTGRFDRSSFRSKPKVSSIEGKSQFDRRVNVYKNYSFASV